MIEYMNMKKSTLLFCLVSLGAGAATIKDVKVELRDGFGGDVGAILSHCQTKSGLPYDPVTVTRDVKSLTDSGQFQDITADASESEDGVTVVFSVFRKLRYHGPMVVTGNEKFSASKIANESGLKDGYLYGEADFATAAEKIANLYRKKNYYKVNVIAVPKMLATGNSCTLSMAIDEGPCSKISSYEFDGIEEGDESELRSTIDVLPWWNPRGWVTDRPVTKDDFAAAVQKIVKYYTEKGYLDVSVGGPERRIAEDGTSTIVFQIDEGPLYKIGGVSIEGVTKYPVEKVAQLSSLPEKGTVAGSKILDDAAHSIAIAVGSGDMGLAGTQVTVRKIPSEADPNVVDIVFAVEEGVPVVIDQIEIIGNDYTKDEVIRREISLSPGNRMLEDRADQSKKRLENLNYFSRVNYSLKPSGRGKNADGAEYRNLVYEVEEKNTGAFSVGVGASSVDSVFASVELQQTNFDIFAPGKLFRGAGQKGRVNVMAGPRIQTYEASVTEPYFLGRQLEFTVEGYRRQRWFDDYDVIRNGAAATLAYPVKFHPSWKPFGRFGVRLSTEFIQMDDCERGYWMYKGRPVTLTGKGGEEDKYGDAFEAVVRLFWSHDTRDNFRIPTRGYRANVFTDVGTGDNQYWHAGFSYRHYWNVVKRYNHVLMFGLRGESIDAFSDKVPIYNRMFLGGPRSIRGVEYRHVSPMARKIRGRDADGDLSHTYSPWGGQTLFCGNLEYTVPIVSVFRLAAFSDMGAVGADEFDFDMGDTFAWTAGIGLRFDIPMFPIRLDFGAPIKKPDHADKEVFSFSIGYDF